MPISASEKRSPAKQSQHAATANLAFLAAYFALSLAHMLWETLPFFHGAAPAAAPTPSFFFHCVTWLGYSALYVALSLLPAWIVARCTRQTWYRALAVIGSIIALLIVRTDRSVFDLYNFHLNGFVLNLVMTPGGIDSLGGGSDSYIAVALLAARIIAVQSIALFVARALVPFFGRIARRSIAVACVLFILGSLLSYGIGDLRNDGAILDTADNYPLFLRLRFRGLATALGHPPATRERASTTAKVDSTRLQYPLQPMRYDGATRPLNIIWLVAESLRWDQLAPDIMPNTYAFAQRGQNFLHHYSSGNGTREGLFGMFYGLYGSYWDNFLHAGRGPLLIDRMQALNYQMDIRTSARFTYPEFDKTLFIKVPPQFMHDQDELNEGAWERDRDNTSALLDYIDKRDAARPFLTFLFFESTHARYSFPDSAIVRQPFLENIDYTEMSREKLAPYADQLRNRYSNSAHWVDVQIGRIVDYLDQHHMLDNTVFIFAGDHGEEFMEKGFWGHNSSFVEEQTHTPLVMWMPGKPPQAIERTTSHMDIAVTLLQMLGASNDVDDYAQGRNLFDDNSLPDKDNSSPDKNNPPRDFIVMSDWHSIGIKSADFKYRIPYTSRGMENYHPTHSDDSPYANAGAERDAIAEHQKIILDAVRNITRFAK